MSTHEPLVPERGCFEVEIATEELKKYVTRWGVHQTPAELSQAGGNILRSKSTQLLILFGIRKNFQ
jgi:hypothetical protein